MARRRANDRAKVIAVVSDMHFGSTVALCPPGPIPLDDGGSYTPSDKVQRWLWQCWGDYWKEVEKVREAESAELLVVSNGDLFEGDHHHTMQIVSRHPGVEFEMARIGWELPLHLKPDRVFIVRGTGTHVGGSGSKEEAFAKSLATEGYPVAPTSTDRHSWWRLPLKLNGLLFDFAHHGRMGRRPWTRKSNVVLLGSHVTFNHLERGKEPPNVCVRSHFHTYVDSGPPHPLKKSTRIVATPAWQILTAHGHKVVTEEFSDIGGVIIVVRGKDYEIRPLIWEAEREEPWTE